MTKRVTKNSDGAIKGNHGLSLEPFCIRDGSSDLIYAEGRRFGDNSNLVAEVLRFSWD